MAHDDLPEGFEVDAPPEGFAVDGPKQAASAPAAEQGPSGAELERMIAWAHENRDKPLAQKLIAADKKRMGYTGNAAIDALADVNLHGGDIGTLGFGDEIAAKLQPGDYKTNRDANRQLLKQRGAQFAEDHPYLSAATSFLSGTPAAVVAPGYAGAAALGAAAGLGNSEAEDASGMAGDTAIGAGLGTAAQFLGTQGGKLAQKAIGGALKYGGKVAQAPNAVAEWMERASKDPKAALAELGELFKREHPYAGTPGAPPGVGAPYKAPNAPAAAPMYGPIGPEQGPVAPSVKEARALYKAGEDNAGGMAALRNEREKLIPEINAEAAANNPEAAARQAGSADAAMKARARQQAAQLLDEKIGQLGPAFPGSPRESMADVVAQAGTKKIPPRQVTAPTRPLAPPAATEQMSMADRIAMQGRMLDAHPEVADLPMGLDNARPDFAGEMPPYPYGRRPTTEEILDATPRQKRNGLEELANAPADVLGKPPAAPSSIDAKRQAIVDAQRANPEALAAFGGGGMAPARPRLPTKAEAFQQLKNASGIDDYDASKADAAYEAWKRGMGPKPPPFEGGHFDEINRMLGLEGNKRVSGAREAWDLLTKGEKNWDEVNTAIRSLKSVPGLERLRMPDDAMERSMNWRQAAEQGGDPSFDFGANVDPKKGERGFGSLDLLAGMAGLKALPAASKIAAHAGRMAEKAGSEISAPDALAKSWLANPSLLAPLAQQPGNMGAGARFVLDGLKSGGQDGLKARMFILQQQPWFRAMGADQQQAAGY